MRTRRSACLVIALAAAVGALSGGCSYNRFTVQNVGIDTQWTQVENQLRRRSALIPNLVDLVKGYAAHEQEVFQAVDDARAKLAGATTPDETIVAAHAESSALARLLAVVEHYPQLETDALFVRLRNELAGAERQIAQERQRYNEKVREYNALRRRFPTNVTAGLFGFKERPFFEPPAEAKQSPRTESGQ